ncbi:MAG: 23S rRNA (adenine(2503)-C(2))-methyltransferase RlmN [Planctomycetes bacterium]|nr:23S rRNA (adenine(2503)-C(2))-methyltransferase RlmN [Planctomycetota bacterium]
MSNETSSLLGMNLDELREAVVACNGKPFHAKQLAQWLYGKRELEFDRMTNLSKELRNNLQQRYRLLTSTVVAREESGEGTTKLGIRLHDGMIIEAVLMRETRADGAERVTACISTQAGCAMGCRFCASGQLGLKRHLSAGEILEQLLHLSVLMREQAQAVDWLTNVVVMGMGEPLHNFDNLLKALTILNAEWGFHFGARRVTVSTVGLPDRIRQLAEQGYQFNLAISLHGVDDASRTALIPTNAGLAKILDAAKYYFEQTRREVTFEYTLVGGKNDDLDTAQRLVELVKDFPRANVNLIPMNPVENSGLETPTTEAVNVFTEELRLAGVNVHVRRRRGRRVQAACGQLRLKLEEASSG